MNSIIEATVKAFMLLGISACSTGLSTTTSRPVRPEENSGSPPIGESNEKNLAATSSRESNVERLAIAVNNGGEIYWLQEGQCQRWRFLGGDIEGRASLESTSRAKKSSYSIQFEVGHRTRLTLAGPNYEVSTFSSDADGFDRASISTSVSLCLAIYDVSFEGKRVRLSGQAAGEVLYTWFWSEEECVRTALKSKLNENDVELRTTELQKTELRTMDDCDELSGISPDRE